MEAKRLVSGREAEGACEKCGPVEAASGASGVSPGAVPLGQGARGQSYEQPLRSVGGGGRSGPEPLAGGRGISGGGVVKGLNERSYGVSYAQFVAA